jgi:CheY-like chemotaxis protein
VRATLPLGAADIRHAEEGRQLRFNGELIPMISLTQALGVPRTEPETEALVLATRSGSVAVTVSEVVDRRRVAVKSLGPILDGSRHLTGAAFLGGGEIVVVVDHNYLGSRARRRDDGHDRRPRVLVVDDSAGVRQLIGATLSGRGFEVQVAGSAKEAVAAMADQSFDALVVDYSMPQSNGVELVRALRSAGVSLPIIMVSGVATPDDQAAAWEAGVDAYLDKFDLRQGALTASLRSLLHMRSEQEPAP